MNTLKYKALLKERVNSHCEQTLPPMELRLSFLINEDSTKSILNCNKAKYEVIEVYLGDIFLNFKKVSEEHT